MAMQLTDTARRALDLASQSVPEGGELDIGRLLAALYHGTPLKERLQQWFEGRLEPPHPRRSPGARRTPNEASLRALLGDLYQRSEPVTPEILFRALLDSDAGLAWLEAQGLAAARSAILAALPEPERSAHRVSEQVKTHQPPLPPGEGWGEGVSNESLPAHPFIKTHPSLRAPDDRLLSPAGGDHAGRGREGLPHRWRASPERRAAIEALGSYGRMLTATEPPYQGSHGLEPTLHALWRSLSRMKHRSAILIGYPGTGRTAAIYELARQLYHGAEDLPAHLRELDIFELSPWFLRSGAASVGQYEERVKDLVRILEAHPQILLFVDDIHTLFSSGLHEREPFSDAHEALQSRLARGAITALGCATPAEYRQSIEPDPGLASLFGLIRVEPPTQEITVEILKVRRPRLEAYFSPPPLCIPDAMLRRAVELTEDYLPGRFQPAKSLRLLDEACAWCVTADDRPEQVTEEALWKALEGLLGHGVVRARALDESDLLDTLNQAILGQEDTLQRLARTFLTGLGGWGQRTGPRGVYCFCGPTGVGKTETALLLGRILGGGHEALVRVNCNLLQGGARDAGPALNILLGAPPGYLGYVRGQGGLLSRVRDIPEGVVLFDEIEKADPGVADILLQIMDTGLIEDHDGNRLDFRRAFLIFTTNAGAVYDAPAMGFLAEAPAAAVTPTATVDAVLNALRQAGFGEEFFGRIDEFFVFQGLDAEAIRRVVALQLETLRASADVRGYRLEWDEAVVDILANCWEPRFGVRHLSTILRHRIVEQLSLAEARQELSGVQRIELRVLETAGGVARQDLAGLVTRDREGETLRIHLA